jgi:sRNA-binding regulator protein Hfq
MNTKHTLRVVEFSDGMVLLGDTSESLQEAQEHLSNFRTSHTDVTIQLQNLLKTRSGFQEFPEFTIAFLVLSEDVPTFGADVQRLYTYGNIETILKKRFQLCKLVLPLKVKDLQ